MFFAYPFTQNNKKDNFQMKKMKYTAFVIFLLSIITTLLSCNFSSADPNFLIHGVVVDSTTEQPISGAIVSDGMYGPDPKKYDITDSRGKYSYLTWYEEHTIIAEAPGYKSQQVTIITKLFKKEEKKEINFSLIPE